MIGLFKASTKLHGTQVITEASADILLRRGTRPSEAHPGKVEYTRDVRHTVPGLYGYPVGSIIEFAQSIRYLQYLFPQNFSGFLHTFILGI